MGELKVSHPPFLPPSLPLFFFFSSSKNSEPHLLLSLPIFSPSCGLQHHNQGYCSLLFSPFCRLPTHPPPFLFPLPSSAVFCLFSHFVLFASGLEKKQKRLTPLQIHCSVFSFLHGNQFANQCSVRESVAKLFGSLCLNLRGGGIVADCGAR